MRHIIVEREKKGQFTKITKIDPQRDEKNSLGEREREEKHKMIKLSGIIV